MKNLIIMLLVSLYTLTGCEKKIPVECVEPLKMYDELIKLSSISEDEKKQLIDFRNQLKRDVKNARTEHLAIVVCGESYTKLQLLKQQYNKD